MSRVCCALVSLAILLSATPRLSATTVIPPTFAELVDRATEIFVGQVVSRECRWIDTPSGRAIITIVTFSVEETLKGPYEPSTSLRFLGGTIGDITLSVADMPTFNVGDRDLLFVGDRRAVGPLVGFMHGRFRIERDASDGLERLHTHDGRPLAETRVLGHAEARPRSAVKGLPLAEFRSEVLGRLGSRGGR